MAEQTQQPDLFPATPSDRGAVVINDRCLLRSDGAHRIVLVAGLPIASYAVGDDMAEAHAMVSLVERGHADQNDVARAFECSSRTVRRHQRRFEDGGIAALGHGPGYPKGRTRLKLSRTKQVSRLKAEGASNREIARKLGVNEKAVRKVLRRLGWKAPTAEQMSLPCAAGDADPKLSAPSSMSFEKHTETPPTHADPNVSGFHAEDEPSVSHDTDPTDRRTDRLLAYLGLIDDAAPMFTNATGLPNAAVLLAIPALVSGGILGIARSVYGSIGPAFYGLRSCLLVLLLMGLLRIKRPEALKEHVPAELGAIIGLDRAPEVKTLRRKLTHLAKLGRASALGHELGAQRVAARGEMMGFLYLDGHVRVYHGQHTLPKAHVAQMRVPMPATTDYWVNDASGDPLFVLTAEANAGLTKMLPTVLTEIRSLVGERRLTVVFDRGGWSPALFKTVVNDGFDILTYRKGRVRSVPRKLFAPCELTVQGRTMKYILADTGVRLRNGLRLRQVTWLSENGTHQTPIITSRRDLAPAEIAYRMFERWRQENFFKYLREEYAIDALADYAVEPDNPSRDVPNPVWHQIDAQLREAKTDLASLYATYGIKAAANPESSRPTMRGFKIAHGKLGHEIRQAMKRVNLLRAKRDRTPHRVPVKDTVDGPVIRLAPEKKLLTNILKMVAYQAETDLYRMVAPHYKRAEDEGRTLIQAAMSSAADIEVTTTEIRVTIAQQSSALRTKAIAALCDALTQMNTTFPGTNLTSRYAVRAPS
jgi:transposase